MTPLTLVETFGGSWHIQSADDAPYARTYCGVRVVPRNAAKRPLDGLDSFGALCEDCVRAARVNAGEQRTSAL